VTGTYAEIIANPKTIKFYQDEIRAKGKEAGVSSFVLISIFSSSALKFPLRFT